MSPDRDILNRNIGLLLRHAYVPALPEPRFRQRLLHTLAIEARRLSRERAEQAPAERAGTVVRFPRRRRIAAGLALAAAVLLLAFGAFFVAGPFSQAERAFSRADLVARGDVALQVGTETWRAASADELEDGFTLAGTTVTIETPTARSFDLATSAGRVALGQRSTLRGVAEANGLERLLLTEGSAAYAGPDGSHALRVDEELRLLEGVPESSPGLVLAGAKSTTDVRNPVPVAEEPEQEPAPEKLATLAGDVLTADGEPVEAFRIGILQRRLGNEYGNPDTQDFEYGTFAWENIPPAEYQVFVSAEGYAVLDLGWMTLTDEHDIDARLPVGGTLRGHVLDETGNPVPGALVLSEEDAPQDGLLLFPDADEYQWLPTSTRTLADGSFELANVSPGVHTLRVTAKEYGATWSDDFAVSEGAVRDGLSIELKSAGAVEGRVTRADGTPRVDEQIVVAIMNDDARPHMNFSASVTDADGRYRIDDLPERMMLVIHVEQRFDARPVVTPVEIVAGKTAVVDFKDGRPGVRVFGRVLGSDGRPIAHHNIALMDKHSTSSQVQTDFDASTTLSDGSFLFEGIEPGEYLVYLVEEMGRWIRLVDQFEVPDWPELERIIEVAELEVVGSITDARNGEKVGGCSVALELLEDGDSVFAGNTFADEDGRFTFGLLNAGRYRVSAQPTTNGLGFQKSDALVIDEASPRVEIELQLTDGAAVTVRVVDPQGAPIPGATIYFVDEARDGFVLSQLPLTDENGIYRAQGVHTGALEAQATAQGYVSGTARFQCRANQENQVEVTLTPLAPATESGEQR